MIKFERTDGGVHYDKPHAPKEIKWLQRWCNNRAIFKSEPDFEKYGPRRRK